MLILLAGKIQGKIYNLAYSCRTSQNFSALGLLPLGDPTLASVGLNGVSREPRLSVRNVLSPPLRVAGAGVPTADSSSLVDVLLSSLLPPSAALAVGGPLRGGALRVARHPKVVSSAGVAAWRRRLEDELVPARRRLHQLLLRPAWVVLQEGRAPHADIFRSEEEATVS